MPESPATTPEAAPGTGGARRTRNAAGINRTAARKAIESWAVRQSYVVINQLANGEIVMGATPMPAETSETARLRFFSNQPVVVAISGATMAPAATPTSTP